MPGYDGIGPQGTGPIGRGLGPCGQGRSPARRPFLNFRRGWRGRGFRWLGNVAVNEKADLESEKGWLTQQLEAIEQRLNELKEE